MAIPHVALRGRVAGIALALLTGAAAASAQETQVAFESFDVDSAMVAEITQEWVDDLLASHPAGTWAPLKFSPTDAQLARMGLPPRSSLAGRRFPEPTLVLPDGSAQPVDGAALGSAFQASIGPAVTSYAGTGCMGIRPGAWLLLLSDGIGWCTMAHVYGSPGTYKVSTAGHCGKVGDTATVIAAFGNRADAAGAVLLDFGKFSKSTGDGGIGKDWALIDVDPAYQHLVSPTMCAWGGPKGMYTKQGAIATATVPRRGLPFVTLTPDPALAQVVAHYGHGTGVGATGTPRAGGAQHWGAAHYAFFGAITFGDSGSGANAVPAEPGDGDPYPNEAAGINTHIYVDPSLKTGLGYLAGTRATLVTATLANGQIVPYPVPFPGLP